MSLFQKSVLKKYLNELSDTGISESYDKFQRIFNNPKKQQNIINSKEEQYQEGFLRELFVQILGYTLNPDENYNLITEQKNEKDSKKADGAILNGLQVLAVIELKSTKTIDLGTIESQAFGYKNNQQGCKYVITSNFRKLRFYIENAVEFEEFDLFNLSKDQFKLLWICLSSDYFLKGIPHQIKANSNAEEENVTKQLYLDYAGFRTALFRDISEKNPQTERLLLFKKTQKLLDRFLFLFFAEDRGLVSPNWTRKILQDWTDLKDRYDNYLPLYDRFRKNFDYLNTGYSGKDGEIFAYNGGLFASDELLDNLAIDDDLLYHGSLKLSNYDFETEVDVNILGHIFEHSLNEIDEIEASLIDDVKPETKKVTKRKKDGVFYTPKYITKYIVENTIGTLCKNEKEALGIIEGEFEFIDRKAKGALKAKRETLNQRLNDYRQWLLKLKIVDPACGSGAFLNQALEFLITEHRKVDELKAQLLGGSFVISDVENSILENNLYGVDINEEAIEIAKLSLWLRTARKGRKLSSLNSNIKCGNSIIPDVLVAGQKAFVWHKEFDEVFQQGGFDVVIGNPPYGAYLNGESKSYLQTKFNTFQGNFEIYFFFIELVSFIIREKGKIGFITPDTWINIPQATKLREHVLIEYGIDKIITFSYPVFSDASVNAIVVVMTSHVFNSHCDVVNLDGKILDIEHSLNAKKSNVERWSESVDKQFQVLQTDSDIRIIQKINERSSIAEKYLDVCQGIVPYSSENLTKEEIRNRIYHNTKKENDNYGIWVQGRAINRYSLTLLNEEYLNYGSWLHRSRKLKYFTNERILIQEITGGHPPRISAVSYQEKLFHDPGIIACLNISDLDTRFLLAIINSKLISWYNLMTSPKGNRTTFPKILIGDIRKLPIIEVEKEKQVAIIQQCDIILRLNKDLQVLTESFSRFISSNIQHRILPSRLVTWFTLSFSEFIAELNKILRLNKLELLSKKEEFSWIDIFEEQKAKACNLRNKIDQVDRIIDVIIYEFYDLTEEEIKIIENE